MENTEEFLKTLPMYYNYQIGELDKLILAWKESSPKSEAMQEIAKDFERKSLSPHHIIDTLFNYQFFKTESGNTRMGIVHSDGRIIDEQTEYSTNSMGFRSKEFSKEDKVLAVGCSHTHGMGLRKDLVWTEQLANKLGIDEMPNVAVPGGSIMHAVDNCFKYFYEFGNPEYLLFFAPDLYRFRITQNVKFNIAAKHFANLEQISFMDNAWVNPNPYSTRDKVVKAPYISPDIIPIEYIFWLNMQFLKMLIIYCRTNNIKLLWTTWHMPFAEICKSFKSDNHDLYKEFFYMDFNQFSKDTADKIDCHHDIKASGPEYFNHGLDTKMAGAPHWGSHLHAHIAEEFFKEIKEAGYEV
jgi:hypothetical protein